MKVKAAGNPAAFLQWVWGVWEEKQDAPPSVDGNMAKRKVHHIYTVAVTIFVNRPFNTEIHQMASGNKRKEELTLRYFSLLDSHLDDLVKGNATEMYELADIARVLCVSQKHLIKIIREERGNHPCHFYVQKIIERSKELLLTTDEAIAQIAYTLTFDPSNFTKFFKKHVGITPSAYRAGQKAKSSP